MVGSGTHAVPATWEVAKDCCNLGAAGQAGQHRKTLRRTTNIKKAVGDGVDGGHPGNRYLVEMPHPLKVKGPPRVSLSGCG